MIKIEKTQVTGWEPAIRGMRNSYDSWDKSDSGNKVMNSGDVEFGYAPEIEYIIGSADLTLMKQLCKAGSSHRKFMRMLVVYCDITAPLYWWSEADTYRNGVEKNSCSKMHKLLARPFEMSDFSFDRLPGYRNEVKQFRPEISEEMVAQEVWCPTSDGYEVSNYGRVKHILSDHYRIVSGTVHDDGYIFVWQHGKQVPVHRIVALAFHAEAFKEGLVVNHIDGNKMNNFASNLEWVTQKENIIHSTEHHLQPNAVTTYKGKFTDNQRQEIKRLWDMGEMSKRQIAVKYGVSHTCINNIINDRYKYASRVNLYEEVAKPVIDMLNELRDSWFRCESEVEKKQIWYAILQMLPESYNQKRTCMITYEALANMYHDRKNHRLGEWRDLCKWIETLPHSELITGEEK